MCWLISPKDDSELGYLAERIADNVACAAVICVLFMRWPESRRTARTHDIRQGLTRASKSDRLAPVW
jgi:hypothetical protein